MFPDSRRDPRLYANRRRPLRSAAAWRRERRLAARVAVLLVILGALMTQVVLGGQANAGSWVTVRSGQSLWTIAAAHYTQSDPREAILEIQGANHLQGAYIYAGERLLLPSD
jgi:hypothetical protein